MWGSTLKQYSRDVLQQVVRLHAAVLWDPQSSHRDEFIFKDSHSQEYDLRGWPYYPPPGQHPPPTQQPGSSAGGDPEVGVGVPTTTLNPLAIMEAGTLPSSVWITLCTDFSPTL